MHVRGISRTLLSRCTNITVNERSAQGLRFKPNLVETRVMFLIAVQMCLYASIVRFSCMSSPNQGLCNGDGLPREQAAVAQQLLFSGVRRREADISAESRMQHESMRRICVMYLHVASLSLLHCVS